MSGSATPELVAEQESDPVEECELINSRYKVLRLLGRGGMGSVFLAEDKHRDDQLVALKRVRSDRIDKKTLSTIRNEFLSLASLAHPNISRVYDFGLESETRDIFFTAEYVEGTDWLEMAAALDLEKDEDMRSFLQMLVGVLRGLEFIHSRNLVHLDLKPDNVLVRPATSVSEGPVPKLIDFGLARREKEFGGKRIMGTTYYIAPETILGARVDRRTDLYSLGVLLYQLSTSKLPFRGKSNLDIFKGHLEQTPKPPHEIQPALPHQLSTIILLLMEKKPGDRFQSAAEVIDEINRELKYSFALETEESALSYLESARSVGRVFELEEMHGIFSQASKTEPLGLDEEEEAVRAGLSDGVLTPISVPEGRLVMLRGERGLGKRLLMNQLRHCAQTQGACVLEVECGVQAEDLNQDFFNYIRQVLVYASQLGCDDNSPITDDAMSLAREVKRHGDNPLTAGIVDRLDDLSRKLITASRRLPYLIFFHEMHMADEILAQCAYSMVRAITAENSEGSRLLMVASTLDQIDIEGTHLEKLYKSSVFRGSLFELSLERLDSDNVSKHIRFAFAESKFPDDFHRRVLEESDGNPEIIQDILGFFLRRQMLRRSPQGWLLQGDYRSEEIPGKVRTELKSRIEALPEAGLELAMAFAYLGGDVDLDLAVRLAEIPAKSVERCVSILRREKIIELRSETENSRSYAFVHSSARNLLYQRVPESDRAAEHQKVGTLCEMYFEETGVDDCERLAYHFLQARSKEKGVRYGAEAARSYTTRFQPGQAIATYEQALHLAGDEGDDEGADADTVVQEMRWELASVLFEVGNYDRVVQALEPLLLSEEKDARSRVALWTAKAKGRLGEYGESARWTQKVIDWAEAEGSKAVLTELLITCADLHTRKGNLVESLRCCQKIVALESESPEILSRLNMLLAENHFRLDNVAIATQYCQTALRIVDGRRDHAEPDVNLFCLGCFYKYKGQLLKAVKQFELAAQVSRKLGAADRRADALLEIGRIQQWLERPQAALPALTQALEIYNKNLCVPSSVDVLCVLGETHRVLGEYEEAKKCLGEAFKKADELSNNGAKLLALQSYAGLCLDAGDLASAERYLAEAESRNVRISGYIEQKLLELRFALAVHRGKYGDALDHAAKALVAGGQGDDRVGSAHLLAQRAMLQCRLGKRMDARRALVMLLDIAKSYNFPLCEGRARMLEGMILESEKKPDFARKAYDLACEVFRKEGCERELVQLYLEKGLLALRERQFEDSYLNLEEGFYLAKKLNLTYMKCRYYLAMGLLEISLPEGVIQKAEERFRFAEQMASQVPYVEVLWQVQYYLGKLYQGIDREREGEAYSRQAVQARRQTTDNIPLTFRHGYLRESADEKIETLVDEALARLALAAR